MKNDELEKALEETWNNKEKFYEGTKGLSMLEILKRIETKYKVRGTACEKEEAFPHRQYITGAHVLRNNVHSGLKKGD